MGIARRNKSFEVEQARRDSKLAGMARLDATGIGLGYETTPRAAIRRLGKTLINTTWKLPARVATTTDSVLATTFENADVIDGVTLATGDRILIKNQTAGSENGIYIVNATGTPTRASDFDDGFDSVAGVSIIVEEGTANADTFWFLTTNNPITLDTTSLTFIESISGDNLGDHTATEDLKMVTFGITDTGTILPDANGTRDIGSALLSYDSGWFRALRFDDDVAAPTGTSPHKISTGTVGMDFNVDLTADKYTFYFNGVSQFDISSTSITHDNAIFNDVLTLNDTVSHAGSNGQFYREGVDVKIFSGGAERNVSTFGSGSQTPWTSDIDADGFDLKDLSNIEFRVTTGTPASSVSYILNDTSGDMVQNVAINDQFFLTVDGTTALQVKDGETEIRSTFGTATTGPQLSIFNNDSGIVVNDRVGLISFRALNSTPSETQFGSIEVEADVLTAAAEEATMNFVCVGASGTPQLTLQASSTGNGNFVGVAAGADKLIPSSDGSQELGDATHHWDDVFTETVTLKGSGGKTAGSVRTIYTDASNMIFNMPSTDDSFQWKINNVMTMEFHRNQSLLHIRGANTPTQSSGGIILTNEASTRTTLLETVEASGIGRLVNSLEDMQYDCGPSKLHVFRVGTVRKLEFDVNGIKFVKTHTNAGRPTASSAGVGAMIYNTDDKGLNLSDGTDWYGPSGGWVIT